MKINTTTITPYKEFAQTLTIQTDQDLIRATEYLSQVNKAKDMVEAYKEKKSRPSLTKLKVIREETLPLIKTLEEVIARISKKMGMYHEEQLRLQKQKENDILKQIANNTVTAENGVLSLSEIREAKTAVTADSGSIKFREVQCFKVLDIKSLPAAYLLPNEPAIRQAMKDGIALAGVKYYTEQRPTNFRN